MKKTFLITYKLFDEYNNVLKEGEYKVKNKINSIEAQCKFEEFLKVKYKNNFGKLIIKKCIEENTMNSMFGGIFGDIFK